MEINEGGLGGGVQEAKSFHGTFLDFIKAWSCHPEVTDDHRVVRDDELQLAYGGGEWKPGDSAVKRMAGLGASTRLLVMVRGYRHLLWPGEEDGPRPCTPATGPVVTVDT